MIATTWNDVHRMISNATCRLFSDEVPILLRMPDGGTMRMAVKDANVVPAWDGYALLIELCDPESEKLRDSLLTPRAGI